MSGNTGNGPARGKRRSWHGHISIALEQILVDTPTQTKAFAFLGSPTVQVGGRDIEPEGQARTDFGLT